MKSKLYCKILAVGIIVLFMGVSVSSAISVNNNEVIVSDIFNSVNSENYLNWKHLFPLIIDYYFIEHEQIKMVVKNIIIDLIFTGETALEEILGYVEDTGLNPDEVYLLSKIETTDWSDGLADCYPGDKCLDWFGYNSRGSYVRYKYRSDSIFGWHLEIDGDKVSEKSGHAIGYYGYVNSGWNYLYPPGEYPTFILEDGYALIIFHGC